MKKLKAANILFSLSAAVFIVLIILKPEICTEGAAEGILLSGRVIIPSLFPFTACVLFIRKSGTLNIFKFFSPVSKKAFGLPAELFTVMLLSFLGGYPIGAKLLNEAVKDGKITPENAGIMLNYCVNAGPAFIVLAVGRGIAGSARAGYILLAAHISASFILSIFFGLFIRKNFNLPAKNEKPLGITDNFVLSVTEAASAVFSVCAYVVLFSAIIAYINYYSVKFPFLRFVSPLLEITNAAANVHNILIISFLLGFAGICIWCQILSVGWLIKINFPIFVLSRIAHGFISAVICFPLLKIFGVAVTVSGGLKFTPYYGSAALSLSMLCMITVFIISLFGKKKTGNILEDIV